MSRITMYFHIVFTIVVKTHFEQCTEFRKNDEKVQKYQSYSTLLLNLWINSNLELFMK
jgi:hypothetical protein